MDSQLSLSPLDTGTLVKLRGKASMEMATELHALLLRADLDKPVLLDWAEADHVEACVLQVLVACGKTLEEHGQSLSVQADNARVRGYLELSGLAGCFPLASGASAGNAGVPAHG